MASTRGWRADAAAHAHLRAPKHRHRSYGRCVEPTSIAALRLWSLSHAAAMPAVLAENEQTKPDTPGSVWLTNHGHGMPDSGWRDRPSDREHTARCAAAFRAISQRRLGFSSRSSTRLISGARARGGLAVFDVAHLAFECVKSLGLLSAANNTIFEDKMSAGTPVAVTREIGG